MSRRTQKNVGVIGLGIIGRRVADNLRRRGFHVFVWNRTPRPVPNFVGSPAELAELCDFIQIFVSDDEALMQMVQQMKPSLHVQHVIMAHSTVAPHTMRNAAEIVQRRGAQFLDAPFTGSKVPAEKGELVYYVAGDDAAYRRAKPVLEASSKEIIEIGEIGQATTVKIATNMVTAATVQAAAEALALVHHSGLAPDKLIAALRGNASNSGTLSIKLPKMIEGDFDPHFSVKHMLKDVQIAARMARSYGLTLGATEAARDSLLDEAQSGRGDQDFASLVRFFFPDRLPGELSADAEDDDAQQKLDGVDDEAASQLRSVERPTPAEPARELFPDDPDAEKAPHAVEDDAENDETVTSAGHEARRDETPAPAEREPHESAVAEKSDAPAARLSSGIADDAEAAVSAPEDKGSTRGSESKQNDDAFDAIEETAPDRALAERESDVAGGARDISVERTEPSVEQTEPSVERTEPSVERTEPSAERTESSAEQTEPSVERTEASIERAEPADERTEGAVQRAEPADERVERADSPADAVNRPAEATDRESERDLELAGERGQHVEERSGLADRSEAAEVKHRPAEEAIVSAHEIASSAEDDREFVSEAGERSATVERDEPAVANDDFEAAAESAAEAEEDRVEEPAAVASTPAETPVRAAGDYDIGGEPPRERRANGDRQPTPPEPAHDREDAAARRSFLSRMFGKGGDN